MSLSASRPLSQRVVEAKSRGPWVYHVTPFDRLARIQRSGLLPNSPMSERWGEHAGHVKGRVFFTSQSGLNFWFKAFLRQLPVVVRTRAGALQDVDRDAYGSEDADADAYVAGRAVPAGRLDVWNGVKWASLPKADLAAMAELARQKGEPSTEEDMTVVKYDPWTFQPPELRSGVARKRTRYDDYRTKERWSEDDDFNRIYHPMKTRTFQRSAASLLKAARALNEAIALLNYDRG